MSQLVVRHQYREPARSFPEDYQWANKEGLACVFRAGPFQALLGGISNDATDEEVVQAFAYAVDPEPFAMTLINVTSVDGATRQITVAWDNPAVAHARAGEGSRWALARHTLCTAEEEELLVEMSAVLADAEDELRLQHYDSVVPMHMAQLMWSRMQAIVKARPHDETIRRRCAVFQERYGDLLAISPRKVAFGVTHAGLNP